MSLEANFTCPPGHWNSIFTYPRTKFTCPGLSSLGYQGTEILFSLTQEQNLLVLGYQAWVFSCPVYTDAVRCCWLAPLRNFLTKGTNYQWLFTVHHTCKLLVLKIMLLRKTSKIFGKLVAKLFKKNQSKKLVLLRNIRLSLCVSGENQLSSLNSSWINKYQVIIWLFFDKSYETSDEGMTLQLVLSHIALISTVSSTENQIKNNLAWVWSLEIP